MFLRFSLLMLLAALSGPSTAEPGQLQDILERMIQSYGGEENLRKLDSMTQQWDMVALMGNRHGTDVRSIRIPGKLRVELTYPDKKEIRVLNGDTGWVIYDGAAPAAATLPQTEAMQLQSMRLYSPVALRDRIGAVSLTTEGDLLALSLLEKGLRVDYLVNQKDWRIEKVVGTLRVNGNEMRFLTEYSDFAFMKGVLVHQRENKYAGNVNTAVLRLRRIEFDAEFSDEHFEP